jgi:hypothetical protein
MAGTLTVDTLKSGLSTPTVFQNTSGTEIGQLARSWINYNGGATPAIRASFNVSSVTKNTTGDYTHNFSNALADANFGVVGTTQFDTSGSTASAYLMGINIAHITNSQTTTSVRYWGRYGAAIALYDQYTIALTINR